MSVSRMAMALPLPLRLRAAPAVPASAPAQRACVRGLSSSRPSPQAGSSAQLLNILADPPQPSSSQPKLTTRIAHQTINRSPQARAVEETARRASYQKQIARAWNAGDVYAPHDLTGAEQKKWKMGRRTPQSDAFDRLGINPITEYKNFTLMSEYMTEMGRIKHSRETGLRPKNQRKVAKAIRRAIGLGLMPSVHRHPLVLKKSSPMRFQ